MNIIFFALVAIAFVVAAWRHVNWVAIPDTPAPMEALGLAMIDTAKSSVTLALGLIGVMALFLGLMKVAEEGGLLRIIAKLLRPLMIRLFPDVPSDHPAMGAMIMNISANALGLGNAATPFGIRAMQELDRLNPHRGTATDSMALFLAINTSSVTLLPTGVIALRASMGSQDPAGIVPTTLVATICSTAVAILVAKFLAKRFRAPAATDDVDAPTVSTVQTIDDLPRETGEAYPIWISALVLCGFLGLVPLTVFFGTEIAPWIIPGLMLAFLSFGIAKKVSVYEAFVEGAREGFQVAIRIIPYLVAILVAVSMFRSSGAMDLVIAPIAWLTEPLMPAEALPMALMRPLSGSGAYGIMAGIMQDPAVGPDSYTGYLVSTIQGSTETTFYVLAVYFGAVQIKRVRHALAAALSADVAGILAAVAICWVLFGAVVS